MHHARLIQDHPFQWQLDCARQVTWQRLVRGLRGRDLAMRVLTALRAGCRGEAAAPPTIETILLSFARGRAVVGGTPLTGTLLAMAPSATERATQVLTTCVTRMRQKPNPTVHASHRAAAQFRMGLEYRVQRGLVLPDQRVGAIVLVPIRSKRETLLDGDDKKARLSVRIRMVCCTPSSYLVDAKASRGRARILVALSARIRNRDPHQRSNTGQLRRPCRLPIQLRFTKPHTLRSAT